MVFKFDTPAQQRYANACLAHRNRQFISRRAIRRAEEKAAKKAAKKAVKKAAKAAVRAVAHATNLFNGLVQEQGHLLTHPLSVEALDNARRRAEAATNIGRVPNNELPNACRTDRRLSNPGPHLYKGPAAHPFYVTAEVNNVETGTLEQSHYDARHDNDNWVWDQVTDTYVTCAIVPIDLTNE